MQDKLTTMKRADKYMFNTYARFPLTLVKGDGVRVWSEEGKEYMDFVGGIAVCALGHSSPIVSKAIEEQARTLIHVSNLYYTKPQTDLAQMLVENSFADKVFFCNSGAEANEAAIKLARRYSRETFGPGRHVIISMENSFHGRTMCTLSATGQKKVQIGFDPLLEGFVFVPFNDMDAMEKALDKTVCAVILEPIQGEGGIVIPDAHYLESVRSFCDRNKLLLIFDEVQVGMGRTGKLFAHEHFGVKPDIMTLAKALGNGLPIGAMLAHDCISQAFGPGSHATTFGGTPLVTAVAKAVLNTMLNEGLLEHCTTVGEYFKNRLIDLSKKYPFVKEVRGKGLILGMELETPCGEIVKSCMAQGFLINCTHDTVLRFIPPLVVKEADIDALVKALDRALDEFGKAKRN